MQRLKQPLKLRLVVTKLICFRVERIGKGGFSEVYKVIRIRDGKVFAAKFFTPQANKRTADAIDPVWLTRIRKAYNLMKENPHVSPL